jgi:outer membrane murein-binding lipoprotein Lpp
MRSLNSLTSVAVLAFTTLAGCDRQTSPSTTPSPSAQVMHDLSAKIDRLEAQIRRLESRVDSLEVGSSAVISTEDELYGLARTSHGTFVISAKRVTPYLDGFKVLLEIGNLTSANFLGAEISVSWGSAFGNSRRFKVLNRFNAGSFTDVEVALTPAKAEDVKRLATSILVDQLNLRR